MALERLACSCSHVRCGRILMDRSIAVVPCAFAVVPCARFLYKLTFSPWKFHFLEEKFCAPSRVRFKASARVVP